MEESAKKLLSRLQKACARREQCSSDVLEKAVKALDGDRTTAREVLDSLVRDGYIDDLRYASAFAREKSGLTGWGPVKIGYALSAKRIPRDIVDAALAEIDSRKAESRLERLAASKSASLKGDPQIRLKLLKYLLSRGYEYEAASEAVEAALRSMEGRE